MRGVLNHIICTKYWIFQAHKSVNCINTDAEYYSHTPNAVLANVSVRKLANVLLVTTAHFIQALMLSRAFKNKLSLPGSAKWQCAIWDNTTDAEIQAPHNKCTACKYSALEYTDSYGVNVCSGTKKHKWQKKWEWKKICKIMGGEVLK